MSAEVLAFPPFRLDVTDEKLWRGDDLVPLKPTTFALLVHLARNPRRLVTKEELLQHVWTGVTVGEDVVRWYVRELRAALGDDANAPVYVETAPRRGYRFLPEVTREAQPAVRRPSGEAPILVGVLHSLTGVMAATETPVIDATLLAIEELNERGGVAGRRVEARVSDGASDERTFAAHAERLIQEDRVSAIFGTWTSASRKAVREVVEARDHLLFYPVQSEGLEYSANIIYMGASPNQQALPAVQWVSGFLKRWRFFLLGWDSIYSHAVNAIVRDEIEATGGRIAGEEYVQPTSTDVSRIARKVLRSKADVIVSSTVGDINLLCVRALRAAGVTAAEIPIVHLSVGELELLRFAGDEVVGDYAVWNYFQSLDRAENHAWIDRFRRKFGPQRVTADPMEAAYLGVHLWAQAAHAAGSGDPRAICDALPGQTIDGPEGKVTIEDNHHASKTTRIGRIASDGQFEVVWSTERPVKPEPYPRSRSIEAWDAFVRELFDRWGGRWSRPRG